MIRNPMTHRDLKDVPQGRKLERTGKDTFTIHAEGGHKFEGTYDSSKGAPPKGFKSEKIVFTGGVCLRKCAVRNLHCGMCFHFSEYEPEDDK